MEISRNLLFSIVLLVVLLALVFVFKDKILDLITKTQEEYISPPAQEKIEVIEPRFKSLGVSPYDLPEAVIYKLFRSLDTSFLNVKSDSRIIYYPFILNLSGRTYPQNSGALIDMIKEGVRNFSRFDNNYQVGDDTQQPATCRGPTYDGNINYNNDCWTTTLDTDLNNMNNIIMNPRPCKILVHGSGGIFNGKVKIRVGWLLIDGHESDSTKRQIIYTLITICDG